MVEGGTKKPALLKRLISETIKAVLMKRLEQIKVNYEKNKPLKILENNIVRG